MEEEECGVKIGHRAYFQGFDDISNLYYVDLPHYGETRRLIKGLKKEEMMKRFDLSEEELGRLVDDWLFF